MKKSRFTEEQMVAMLREADRTSVAEVSKKHKVSDQTLYGWRMSGVNYFFRRIDSSELLPR